MNKLILITRDGKSANDFMESHSIKKDSVIICKYVKDLPMEGNYVIIPPLPLSYHWSIRPLLAKRKLVNLTKFYTKKLKNF